MRNIENKKEAKSFIIRFPFPFSLKWVAVVVVVVIDAVEKKFQTPAAAATFASSSTSLSWTLLANDVKKVETYLH